MSRLLEILGKVLEVAPDEVPQKGATRSSRWNNLRDEFVKQHPECAVCESTNDLQVHHIHPFEYGGPELDPENLITLCRRCHLLFGHLGAWDGANPLVRADAQIWRLRMRLRRVLTPLAKDELERLRGRSA